MSYCALMIVDNSGEVLNHTEFRNSWGYGAFIWTKLFDKYLKDPCEKYDSWMSEKNSEKLWKLVHDDRLEGFERRVLASTFDNAMVKKANFAEFVHDLQAFAEKYPDSKAVCHIQDMAQIIDNLEDIAICWHLTSVCSNPWYVYDGEKDESEVYNINTREDHWFLDFSQPSGLPKDNTEV